MGYIAIRPFRTRYGMVMPGTELTDEKLGVLKNYLARDRFIVKDNPANRTKYNGFLKKRYRTSIGGVQSSTKPASDAANGAVSEVTDVTPEPKKTVTKTKPAKQLVIED